MPTINNKLSRRTSGKQENAAEIERQISRLEDNIRKLKIDFDIYFNGSSKRPPFEARARLEASMKRLADNRSLTYAQRYYYNSLMATYTSYRELWRRTLRARGEELI